MSRSATRSTFKPRKGKAVGPPPIASVRTTLPLEIVNRAVAALHPNPQNARTHSPKQIELLAGSIARFGFVTPVLLGAEDGVVAGHGRLEAAKSLGMTEVPTVSLAHLSPAEQRAYALGDNRLAELSGWDEALLKLELQDLDALLPEFTLKTIGWEGAELDKLLFPTPVEPEAEPAVPALQAQAVTRVGDLWTLGDHRLFCGDACEGASYAALMQGEQARMCFTDPPYDVPIDGHVRRRNGGHREFVQASGEMGPVAYLGFLVACLTAMAAASMPGAIFFVCMDWRHIAALLAAGEAAGLELKNLVVWAKPNAGLGQFYRSQHELIAVLKVAGGQNLNNFGMGKGKSRSNIWSYPGVNGFKADRKAELELHPTVKPSAMIADAIKDVSRKGDVVLDPFGGSGSTLIAAEKVGRKARLMELDPLYCDVIVRRYQAFTDRTAVLSETGEDFATVQVRRADIETGGIDDE